MPDRCAGDWPASAGRAWSGSPSPCALREHGRHPPAPAAPRRPSPGPALGRGEGGPGGYRRRSTSWGGTSDACGAALSCAIMWPPPFRPLTSEAGALAGPDRAVMRAAARFLRRSVPGRRPGLGAAEGSAHDPAQLRDPGSSRPAVSGVRILAIRAGPGWRGGAAGGRLGRQARGGAAGGWPRPGAGCARAGAAGAGLDAVFSRERGQCRVPATAATAAGRDAPAGDARR
jgi:hypothetical protein